MVIAALRYRQAPATGVRRPRAVLRHALVLMSVALGSCMLGPRYVTPSVPQAAAFKEAAEWKPARPAEDLPRGNWWEVVGDPQLSELIAKVDVNNQNLRLAEAQYRQALGLAEQARAGLFPTVAGTAAESRSRSAALPPAPGTAPFTTYSAGLTASWNTDLWGGIRSAIAASDASAKASEATLASARLSARALLAQNYFSLRIADEQRQLLDDAVNNYRVSFKLTQNRYASGVAAKSDIVQAETQLRSTEASALDVGVQRAQLEHAIAILTGAPPDQLSIAPKPLRRLIPAIPEVVPSQLLERRPDVAAAERLVAAANAQIGVVEAAWFPALTLNGTLGFRSTNFGNLFTLPARYWSLGPALAETIFDGGLRTAQKAQAIAAYDAAVATYRNTVLISFQQVEDNLAALRILAEESRVLEDAVRLARQSVELTLNQYKAGTVNYLNVVAVQAAALANESSAVAAYGRQLNASVLLIQALGGGWSTADIELTAASN